MSSGFTVWSHSYENCLDRLIATSKRGALEILEQEAKINFSRVAKFTPPASEGVTGKRAEKQGKAAVAADIHSIYGTPSDAYDALVTKSPRIADAFWGAYQKGDADANAIVSTRLGSSFAPFDDGKVHKRFGGGKRRLAKRKQGIIYYVSNPEALQEYVLEEQSHVWWLASGWAPALRALGAVMPYGVGKVPSPGTLRFVSNEGEVEIAMVDQVTYAGDVANLQRRIKWALEIRADHLHRNWVNFLAKQAREPGITVKA